MSWLDADVQLYIGGLFESQVCAGMDALRAPIGRPPTRVGDGDYFVIFVLSFAVAQCLSSVFGTSFVSCEGFCIYSTIVHNCRTEMPDLCLGGNSPLDCFYSPSCVSLRRGFRSLRGATRAPRPRPRKGSSPSTSQGLLALDLARAPRPRPRSLERLANFLIFAIEGLSVQ